MVTVGIGIYLAVVVINYGGYIDQIYRAKIDDALGGYFMSTDTSMLSPDEQTELYKNMQWEMEEALGLHQPFLLRSFRWFYQGITFNWGKANVMETQKDDSRDIREIVLEALPNTLLLAGVANAFVFLAQRCHRPLPVKTPRRLLGPVDAHAFALVIGAELDLCGAFDRYLCRLSCISCLMGECTTPFHRPQSSGMSRLWLNTCYCHSWPLS